MLKWSIYNVADDPLTKLTDESVTSVGNIIAVDGAAITPAKTATGNTNADGLSTIKIKSTVTGVTLVQAIADYVGNPYPEKLFDHMHLHGSRALPGLGRSARLTRARRRRPGSLIPRVVLATPRSARPLPTRTSAKRLLLTLTLKDEFGNAIAGRQVEWYMQGVGQFKSDDDQTMSQDGLPFGQDKDIDVTDARRHGPRAGEVA